MPEIVTCPNCTRKLRVPDNLVGKTVKCPECKQAFLAQTESVSKDEDQPDETPTRKRDSREVGVSTGRRGSAGEGAARPSLRRDEEEDEDYPSRPVDDLDDDYEDRSRGRAGARAGWRSVRLGLNLFIYGIYIILGGLVLGLLGIALAALLAVLGGTTAVAALTSSKPNAGAAAGGGGAAIIVAIVVAFVSYGLVILGNFVQWVLQGIGQVFFLWIPDRPGTGRRPLAIATLSLWGAQILLTLSSWALICMGSGLRNPNASGGMGLGANCANFLSALCGLAWFFVFMFLLRSIAQAMGNQGLARSIVIYMIVVPVFAVLAFFSLIAVVCLGGMAAMGLASSSSSSGGGAAIGTGWLVLVIAVYGLILLIALGLWIWYVVILHQTRNSVSRRLAS